MRTVSLCAGHLHATLIEEASNPAPSLLRVSCSDRPRTGFDLPIPDLLILKMMGTIPPILAQPISAAPRSHGKSGQRRRSGADDGQK